MKKRSSAQNVVAGAFGNVLEWYDFAVFGFLAPVLGQLFFPADDTLAGLIKVYGVFAAGYLMRPLGGLILGHFGDRWGRKRALEISILMMAVPTFLVGCLPTTAQAGTTAAALLIGLRLIQGLSVGGELIGSISYIVEMAPAKKRGLHGSWVAVTAVGGILLGSLTVTVLRSAVGDDAMALWGWRVPFLAGVTVAGAGLWLRHGLDESRVFTDASTHETSARSPVVRAVTEAGGRLAQATVLLLLYGSGFYMLFVWMPAYYEDILHPPVTHAYWVNSIAMLVLICCLPIAGALSDRLGRRRVAGVGIVLTALLGYPLFLVIDTSIESYALAAQIVFAVLCAAGMAPIPAFLAEAFPTQIRSSAIGIPYNLAVGVVGGTTPLVSTWFIAETGNVAAPALYLVAVAVLSAAALSTLRVDEGGPLP